MNTGQRTKDDTDNTTSAISATVQSSSDFLSKCAERVVWRMTVVALQQEKRL